MSKCRQMNKLYCEIIKIRGKREKKKKRNITSLNHRYMEKFTVSYICRYSSNTVKYTKLKHFLSKT